MKKLRRVLWGMAFVCIGVLFVMRVYGVLNFNVIDEGWWTLAIIVPCLITLITEKNKVVSLIGIAIGLVLLSGFRGLISFDRLGQLILPVAVIICGLLLIFKDVFKRKTKEAIKQLRGRGMPHKKSIAIFSSESVAYPGECIHGADLVSVFGAVDCNLKDIVLNGDVLVNATGIFGSVDIYVPDDVNIEYCSTPLFGGVSNHTKRRFVPDRPTVYINAVSVFGGVDIK